MVIPQRSDLTFRYNVTRGRHGWLRLTPAYSVRLVADILGSSHQARCVLDPFSGTGTTGLVCAEQGLRCELRDINPFLVWLARAKVRQYSSSVLELAENIVARVVQSAEVSDKQNHWHPPIRNIERWWSPVALEVLACLWNSISSEDASHNDALDLIKVAFCKQVIASSNASFGHQSMSFKDPQATLLSPLEREYYLAEFHKAAMATIRSAEGKLSGSVNVVQGDSRKLRARDRFWDLVVTSPPYPNRMSYVRELRPYMYWLGYLEQARDAGELDWRAIGGTWGVATSRVNRWVPQEAVPHRGFDELVDNIGNQSETLGRYVHRYFHDMLVHVKSLVGGLMPDARLYYVIGNSKFYEWVVPSQDIFASVFRDAGLEDVEIRVIRKRNSKKELFEYLVTAQNPG